MSNKSKKPDEVEDEVGAEMEARVVELEGLLRAHKIEHAQAIRDAQSGGEPPQPQALAVIAKLEVQVSNLKHQVRLRKLTREP